MPKYLLKDESAAYVFDVSKRHLINENEFRVIDFNNYIIVNYIGD